MLKKIICILFFVLILILNCNTPSSDGSSSGGSDSNNPTILSTWEGTFDGDDTGIITNWHLKSDNSTAGTWETSSSISIGFSGTYTLVGNNISFTGSGIAINTSNGTTDNFTLTGNGTVNMTTGIGTGTVTIVFSNWGTYNCNWDVNKI